MAAPLWLAPLPEQMVASVCSSLIVVDARKRTKYERPDADASDVRLVQRPRPGSVQKVFLGTGYESRVNFI